jgi:hypothetical protein
MNNNVKAVFFMKDPLPDKDMLQSGRQVQDSAAGSSTVTRVLVAGVLFIDISPL